MRGFDETEFSGFVLDARPELVRFAYRICGDWHRAEDFVQAVLIRMYPRWTKLAANGNPLSYARHSIVHAMIDERRRPWRRESVVDAFEDTSAPDATDGGDPSGVAMSALLRVPIRQRAVLVLRFLDGLSVEEVALEMGISAGTVKSQTARGLATLRATFEILRMEEAR